MSLTHQQWLDMQQRRKERVANNCCPRCLAPKGQPCIDKKGHPRQSLHAERNGQWRRRGPKPQPTYPLKTS